MATFLSEHASGVKVVSFPSEAGQVNVARFDYVIPSGQNPAANDIIEIGYLPAGCVPVDAVFYADEAGVGTFDVGFVTGTVGDNVSVRTSGSELFAAAADVTVTRLAQASAFRLTKANGDRGIGVKPSASITGAGQRITLVLSYAANV